MHKTVIAYAAGYAEALAKTPFSVKSPHHMHTPEEVACAIMHRIGYDHGGGAYASEVDMARAWFTAREAFHFEGTTNHEVLGDAFVTLCTAYARELRREPDYGAIEALTDMFRLLRVTDDNLPAPHVFCEAIEALEALYSTE